MLSMKVWVLDFDDGIVVAFHFRHVAATRCELKYQQESDDVVASPQSQAHFFFDVEYFSNAYEAQPKFTAPYANVWLSSSFKILQSCLRIPTAGVPSRSIRSWRSMKHTRTKSKRTNIHVEWCCQLTVDSSQKMSHETRTPQHCIMLSQWKSAKKRSGYGTAI